jgi:hypothetical protein
VLADSLWYPNDTKGYPIRRPLASGCDQRLQGLLQHRAERQVEFVGHAVEPAIVSPVALMLIC